MTPNGADDDGGLGRSWNAGGCSSSPTPAGQICTADTDWDRTYCQDSCGSNCKRCDWCSCLDDVGFVSAILDSLDDQFCIDKKRIFATGFSNGAIMAYQIAISLPTVFAAVAPVEGSVHTGYYKSKLGKSNTPISILDIHGVDDTTIPAN